MINAQVREKVHLQQVSNSNQLAGLSSFQVPGFEPIFIAYFLDGLLQGAAGVFPETTFVYYCRTNITDMVNQVAIMEAKFAEAGTASSTTQQTLYLEGITALQSFLKDVSGSVFNCYFSGVQVFSEDSYANLWTINGMLLNFLFNLGSMYSDIMYIL